MTQKNLYGKPTPNFPLLIALVILTLRLSTINSIGAATLDPLQDTKSEFYSVLMNFLLLLSLAICLFHAAFKKKVKSGAGFISALAFAGLCYLSCVFASEKRYAIDAALMVSAAIAFYLLIRQSAGRRQTIAVCIMVMMGLCAINVLESINQLTRSNGYLIEQYETNPALQLETLGIEPGSLEQFMYEHRLYSKDIKGFFTNGNSLGSFALLCFFPALSLLISAVRSKNCPHSGRLIALLSVAICVTMLGMASSKGALGGFAAGLFVYFALHLLQGSKKRNLLLGGFAISATLALFAMLVCAAKFATLPGGNSMLVRGEYWHSTIKMIAANLLGAGGDNFRFLYTAFKLPSAMETVTDPHCFALSIAAQYGLPALVAFLVIVYAAMRHNKDEAPAISEPSKPSLLIPALAAVIMLLARPILLPVPPAETAAVQTYIYITMYLMPALVFFGWCLFTGNRLLSHISLSDMPLAIRASLAAFLTHNLIDLSIFEPGNMLMFFAMLGMLELCKEPKPVFGKTAARKIALGSAGVCAAALILAVLPCGRLSAAVDKIPNGGYRFIDRLAESDKYSSTAASLAARVCVQMQQAGGDRRILLEKAHELYLLEASRNPKSFKPYSSLAKVCLLEAQNGKKDALSEAIVYYQQAIERYPGKASLHVALGRCFEQMGNDEQAMNHFREAWQIEELFDKKFRKMYPGIEPVSRLNKEERRTVDEALGQ